MSRWRCGLCKRIIDSRWGSKCCGTFSPDEEWAKLDDTEAELLFLQQENEDNEKVIKNLLEKLKLKENAIKNHERILNYYLEKVLELENKIRKTE